MKDIIIVGAGLAGLVTALSLAGRGHKVVLLEREKLKRSGRKDLRSTGLWQSSLSFLKNENIWSRLKDVSWPIRELVIRDHRQDGKEIITPFSSREIGEEALGANLQNQAARERLWQAAEAHPHVEFHSGLTLSAIEESREHITVKAGNRSWTAKWLIGADGRKSWVRQQAGIKAVEKHYPQAAIVLMLGHSKPHVQRSVETYTSSGPFTTVPMDEFRSSLVWVEDLETARALEKATARHFVKALRAKAGKDHPLGMLTPDSPCQVWPLSTLRAQTAAKGRILLVGEAWHAMSPIAAQGLNLSLKDVRDLVSLIAENGLDDFVLGRKYTGKRRLDVHLRLGAVDLLNEMVISRNPLISGVRHMGLRALNQAPGLKKRLIKWGLAS